MQTIFRKELKYRISRISFLQIQGILDKEMERDSHGGEDGYWIRSLYFDSEFDGDLQDVLSGEFNKAKIRLRIYAVDTPVVKLEYKCKRGSDQIKYSLDITREQAEEMIRGNYGFLLDSGQPVAREIYLRMTMNGYRPKLLIEYSRIAYLYEANDTRVTFDTDVRVTYGNYDLFQPKGRGILIDNPDSGVLEVKYNNFLCSFIRKALGYVDAQQVANSKYAGGRLFM